MKKSLAERLGYRADDRLLIVNCDDLGSSHAANIATFRDDLERGKITGNMKRKNNCK